MEQFKTIQFRGFEFTVGNHGTLLTKKGTPRKLHLNSSGYMCFTKDKLYLLHRIVATAWCINPDPDNKKFVNHKDGNKLNNRADNLEWVSKSENELHSIHVLGNKRSLKGFQANWENPIHQKPVLVYDLNMNLVGEFKSIKQASSYLNVCISAVNNCLKGRSKTSANHIIKYK